MGFFVATCDCYSYTEFSRWTINMFNAAMLRSEGKWCLVRFCLLKHEKDVSSHLRSSLEVLVLDHNLSFNCACFLLKNLLHSCLLRKHQITTLLMFHYSIVSLFCFWFGTLFLWCNNVAWYYRTLCLLVEFCMVRMKLASEFLVGEFRLYRNFF
jgi:hypothetical protein